MKDTYKRLLTDDENLIYLSKTIDLEKLYKICKPENEVYQKERIQMENKLQEDI